MTRIVSCRFTIFILGFCSMILLDGCGGGGSSGGTNPPTGVPTAANTCVTTAPNTPTTGVLPASDPDGQALVFEVLSLPTKGTLSTDAAGNYRYEPRTGVRGMDKFTFRARDTTGRESNVATMSVLIDGAVRIMPLGDSITAGTTDGANKLPPPGQQVSYRRELYNVLVATANGRYNIDFVGSLSEGSFANPRIGDPDHEGHGGFTSADIANDITGWLNTDPPDIILLHIGTNDLSNNPRADASAVTSILQNIDNWEQNDSRGPWRPWVFVARIIQRLDGTSVTAFNDDIVARVTARNNSRQPGQRPFFVVDQQAGAGLIYSTGAGGHMADNLHPNQSGYDKMATKWSTDLIGAGVLPNCN